MAAVPKEDDNQPVEVKTHDYKLAMKIVKNDIMPANSKSGEYAQEASTAYKAIKKKCHIQPGAVKDAIKIADKEEAKRDDFLRGLANMVNLLTGEKLLTFHGTDLVDQAEGQRPKPKLVTVDDDFEEATEEELAAQRDRKVTEDKPAAGTAAAAIRDMNAKAKGETK